MTAKYIVIDYPIAGESIIIFPETLEHKSVALNNSYAGCKIISAGFVLIDPDELLTCHGESESLHLKSRPELDSELANHMFGRI